MLSSLMRIHTAALLIKQVMTAATGRLTKIRISGLLTDLDPEWGAKGASARIKDLAHPKVLNL